MSDEEAAILKTIHQLGETRMRLARQLTEVDALADERKTLVREYRRIIGLMDEHFVTLRRVRGRETWPEIQSARPREPQTAPGRVRDAQEAARLLGKPADD